MYDGNFLATYQYFHKVLTASELSSCSCASVGMIGVVTDGLVDRVPEEIDTVLAVSNVVVLVGADMSDGVLLTAVMAEVELVLVRDVEVVLFAVESSETGSNIKGGRWSSCNHSLYTWITRRMAPAWLNGKSKA